MSNTEIKAAGHRTLLDVLRDKGIILESGLLAIPQLNGKKDKMRHVDVDIDCEWHKTGLSVDNLPPHIRKEYPWHDRAIDEALKSEDFDILRYAIGNHDEKTSMITIVCVLFVAGKPVVDDSGVTYFDIDGKPIRGGRDLINRTSRGREVPNSYLYEIVEEPSVWISNADIKTVASLATECHGFVVEDVINELTDIKVRFKGEVETIVLSDTEDEGSVAEDEVKESTGIKLRFQWARGWKKINNSSGYIFMADEVAGLLLSKFHNKTREDLSYAMKRIESCIEDKEMPSLKTKCHYVMRSIINFFI